ncbi:MAG: FAD-dependent oxidoreductase [Clostridia bacterium]|nr:FAD-dependent oxidoreductase [Clostridia bacterium]
MLKNNQLQHGERAICSGNAVLARGDNDPTITPAEKKKNVVVIGGGVAGVEAARIAAIRGHNVNLYEASDEIGGQINYADKPPFKDHFSLLKPYLRRQLELTGVTVHLGKTVTKEDILNMNADAVVCATGSKPIMLKIEGADRGIFAKDVLAGTPTGRNVVVIGGGSTGSETAEYLGKQGKTVTIVEVSDVIAGNTGKTAQTVLLGHLKGYGVKILTECRAEKITASDVICKDKSGNTITLKADTVVFAVGERPDSTLYDELKDILPEVYNIGDSNGGGILPTAVYEGYTAGNKI